MLGVVFTLALAPVRVEPETGLPLDTPAIPAAELREDTLPRAAATPEVLYVNFDGGVLQAGCGNDPHYDCSTLAETFEGYVGPYEGNLQQRISILQATRKDVSPFGVNVVVERPADDTDYTMVFYGDLGAQSFAGVAPYIDCEDRRGGDVSFTQGFATSNTGSTVILQEAAHTWGLEHVDSPVDILNPFKSAGINQSFRDECFKIVANTDLEPTPGSCNQIHGMYCDLGYQNSWREMMYLFGPHVADTSPPTLDIVSPEEDSVHVLPITLSLRGDVTDNRHPQIYNVKVFVNGADEPGLDESNVLGLDLILRDPPADDYDLRVVITDEEGNSTEDSVRFSVLPEGSELPPSPEEEQEEPEPAGDTGCRVGGAAVPGWLAFVLLFGTRRRRARA